MYELMGRIHARLAQDEGQGTVEYVGLILLLSVILAGVVKASKDFNDESIVNAITGKLKAAINKVGDI